MLCKEFIVEVTVRRPVHLVSSYAWVRPVLSDRLPSYYPAAMLCVFASCHHKMRAVFKYMFMHSRTLANMNAKGKQASGDPFC